MLEVTVPIAGMFVSSAPNYYTVARKLKLGDVS